MCHVRFKLIRLFLVDTQNMACHYESTTTSNNDPWCFGHKRKHIFPWSCKEVRINVLRRSAFVKLRSESLFGLLEVFTQGWVHKWMRSMFKVVLLPEWKIEISFKIRYVMAHNLQILELKKLFKSDIGNCCGTLVFFFGSCAPSGKYLSPKQGAFNFTFNSDLKKKKKKKKMLCSCLSKLKMVRSCLS